MSVRVIMHRRVVADMLKLPATADVVRSEAQAIERRVNSQGVQTRYDEQLGGERFRSAVIGGYENGATAEHTRDAFLGALDG